MALSLFWIGFPYLMMGFSHAYWMILACATLVGIGNNLWHPTAIPLARQPLSGAQRSGDVDPRHGRQCRRRGGAACGRRSAGVFSWRDVVLINVMPGIVMSALILLYLGRIIRPRKPPASPESRCRMSGVERLRMFGALLKNRALMMLPLGSTFRTMTQSALLTFLPLYLAARHGLFAALDRRLHVRACRPRALSPRRSPGICPTPSAAARSSFPACR